ncbi:GAF domain-containing protein [Streptomyces alanosinicus]|uniref:Histidine kinase n=1 Tax=Streptomyces alanosinicus TaxID=68171 RepID=A0A919D705_9ACTN|nr:GAF domain-containing protein [Streptomyces alanosinicus]GHE11979.1 histidine kinase [Streptomyces alanosinicus]
MIPAPRTPAAEARFQLLQHLGLDRIDPQLDELATALAAEAGAPYAIVNAFNPVTGRQEFVGLSAHPGGDLPQVERSMAPDWGYCPEVAHRTKALVLPNVCAKPRFAVNPVVDQLGIRTYAGAPLIHDPDGTGGDVFGTVCFIGLEAMDQSTGQASLALIKQYRDRVLQLVYDGAGIRLS